MTSEPEQEEGSFPDTNDGLAASTKRLADWTFSLQGVGADLKALMAELKTYWRTKMAAGSTEGVKQILAAVEPAASQGISGSSFNGGITINLGGSTLVVVVFLAAIIGACGVVIGVDVAERAAQERKSAEQATAIQMAIVKQTNDLQRDWFLNTSQLQRDWERQTAVLTEKTQDLQRQYRMAELKYDDVSVVLHRSGLVLPGDYARGPQGNLDTVSFTKPKGK